MIEGLDEKSAPDPIDMDIQRLRDIVDRLSAHFDSVQIFCTKLVDGKSGQTRTLNHGGGNWYARYGQVKEWCKVEEERAKLNAWPPPE